MRVRLFTSVLALALVAAPRAHAQEGGAPVPPLNGPSMATDVPSTLLGLPVPFESRVNGPLRGGPSARYSGDGSHQLVGVGYELVEDWFLLSGAAGYSVTTGQDVELAGGLKPVDRAWLQAAIGLGVAPKIAVAGDESAPVAVSLVPLVRASADFALAFDDPVVPYRLRGEGGMLMLLAFDFGLRLGLGGTFDYDLTHFAEEKVGEAGTIRIGGQLGWLLEETSTYAEDKTPTLFLVGVTGEVPAMESATRPTGLSVTLGVSL